MKLEGVLSAIRRGAAVGFFSYLLVLFLMILYAILNNYDIFSFISREGIIIPAILQLILWVILFVGSNLIKQAIQVFTGEEEPYIEGSAGSIKGMLGLLAFLYIVMAFIALTTVNWTNLWSVLLMAPIIIAFLFAAIDIWSLSKEVI